MSRKCKDCPTWTQTVCHHAFGVFWCVKSGDGEGCRNPLDDVAEAWRKAGWTPDKGKAVPITLPVEEPPKAKPEPPPLSDGDY